MKGRLDPLWVRPMNSLEARKLAGTDGAIFPFWSHDGRSLAFFADSKLKMIDLNGGYVAVVCDAGYPKNMAVTAGDSGRQRLFWGGMGVLAGG